MERDEIQKHKYKERWADALVSDESELARPPPDPGAAARAWGATEFLCRGNGNCRVRGLKAENPILTAFFTPSLPVSAEELGCCFEAVCPLSAPLKYSHLVLCVPHGRFDGQVDYSRCAANCVEPPS